MNNEAYDEGYDAYWEGVDVSENPYNEKKEADARLLWELGWRKARQHDYDESEGSLAATDSTTCPNCVFAAAAIRCMILTLAGRMPANHDPIGAVHRMCRCPK